MLAERIPAIQSALAEAGLDGWFFACFQQNDPIGLDLLGLSGESKLVTRRCYYLIPREGEPSKLVHGLEPAMLDHLPGAKARLHHLAEAPRGARGAGRRAAGGWPPSTAPTTSCPSVSRLDAGTAELLRGGRRRAGLRRRPRAALRRHLERGAARRPSPGQRPPPRHRPRGLRPGGDALRGGDAIDEYAVQRFILDAFEQAGLWAESDPDRRRQRPQRRSALPAGAGLLVADPPRRLPAHRPVGQGESSRAASTPTSPGAAVCAAAPTDRQQEVFDIVAGARDAAWELVRARYPRQPIARLRGRRRRPRGHPAGAATATSSSIAPAIRSASQDHGQGANMDNLETHDTRALLRDDRLLDRARHLPRPATSGCAARSTSPSPPRPPRSPAASRSASCCGCWPECSAGPASRALPVTCQRHRRPAGRAAARGTGRRARTGGPTPSPAAGHSRLDAGAPPAAPDGLRRGRRAAELCAEIVPRPARRLRPGPAAPARRGAAAGPGAPRLRPHPLRLRPPARSRGRAAGADQPLGVHPGGRPCSGEPVGQPIFVRMAREQSRRPWPVDALDDLAACARRRATRGRPATAPRPRPTPSGSPGPSPPPCSGRTPPAEVDDLRRRPGAPPRRSRTSARR